MSRRARSTQRIMWPSIAPSPGMRFGQRCGNAWRPIHGRIVQGFPRGVHRNDLMTDDHRPEVRLSSLIRVGAVTRAYAGAGRVHIPDVFPAEVAQGIARSLKNTVPWR